MGTAWATVDLEALAHNVSTLVDVVAPAAVCAVVKADGYGHGAVPVAKAAVAAGATWLAVAHIGEGEALRSAGIEAPVLVLSEPEPDDLARVARADLRVTLFSTAGVQAARAAAASVGQTIRVHLKVDTGMRRVGADPADVVGLARAIVDDPGLELEALWTHLAVADEPDNPFTQVQLDRYQQAMAALQEDGIDVPLRHAANSAGAIAHPAARFDLVRCGIAVYGIAPSMELAPQAAMLQPAMSLSARVSLVKDVHGGDPISYGLRHTFSRDSQVATLTIGYADGVRRDSFRAGVEVLLGGRRCPIVGTVTMDQIMVDCSGLDVRVGDEAVLIGVQGTQHITAEEVAERLGTIGYEVVCGVGPRVERRWVGC